jgi:hypothetical protein
MSAIITAGTRANKAKGDEGTWPFAEYLERSVHEIRTRASAIP